MRTFSRSIRKQNCITFSFMEGTIWLFFYFFWAIMDFSNSFKVNFKNSFPLRLIENPKIIVNWMEKHLYQGKWYEEMWRKSPDTFLMFLWQRNLLWKVSVNLLRTCLSSRGPTLYRYLTQSWREWSLKANEGLEIGTGDNSKIQRSNVHLPNRFDVRYRIGLPKPDKVIFYLLQNNLMTVFCNWIHFYVSVFQQSRVCVCFPKAKKKGFSSLRQS